MVRSYGGPNSSYTALLHSPADVVVDKNGFVYVDDEGNDRLVVLTPNLECTGVRWTAYFRRRGWPRFAGECKSTKNPVTSLSRTASLMEKKTRTTRMSLRVELA